ncbi:hypothetical protein [Amycolatopsis taiwanensis]|uniref:Uncharacterized protein n=1 Tax=Amycolatopsis taiwanensis TaxID=342230 RepID=A0A9W6R6Z2_9PSEU|nr:hypothetical protein [Amycolatopsis taiwanensis]GLY69450.1 hypothetical protein Atai01_60690 [Amycolatopsis taiwanensis]
MSLSSVTTLAITRDETHPAAELEFDNHRATWGRALVSVIPTEILAVYTASLGVAAGLATGEDPRAYLPFRFAWYAAWLVATPLIASLLYLRKAEQVRRDKIKADPGVTLLRAPWWTGLLRLETVAATVTAAAWFTAMPGSPWQAALSGGAFMLTSMSATTVGVLVVGVIAPLLTSPTSGLPRSAGDLEAPQADPQPDTDPSNPGDDDRPAVTA